MLIAGWVIWLAGAVWYFFELRRGIYRLHPVWTYLLMAAGLGFGGAAVVVAPDIQRWVSWGAMAALTGVFLYWMLVYSGTPGRLRGRPGEAMPDFEVRDSKGEAFRPRDLAGRRAGLYVFYRGGW